MHKTSVEHEKGKIIFLPFLLFRNLGRESQKRGKLIANSKHFVQCIKQV